MILALDLGTRTGWACQVGATLATGTTDFKNGRYEGGGMRFLRFRQWLDRFAGADNLPEAIYFEEVRRHQGTDAAHVYGGLLGTLTAWCEEHKVPYRGVPVGTIKKFATGKGNAGKEMMIAAAQADGRQITDDNEADAYWLLQYALKGE